MSAARRYAFLLVTGAATVASAQSFPWLINPRATRSLVARAGLRRLDPSHINRNQTGTHNDPKNAAPVETNVPDAIDPSAEKPKRKVSWLERTVVQRVQITGNRVLGYHSHQVTGDAEAFDALTYYGRGGKEFTDTGSMSVSGKNVLGFLTFDLAYSTTDFNDPNAKKVTVNYAKGPWAISAGDINGRLLNTNPYANLSRMLRGASAEYKTGRINMRAVRSEARGSTRTISVQGANSVGPYYLESGRIVADSVQVQVDGQPMKLLDDYVVNADIGSITFISRIIAPTSTIVVTYESYGVGTSGLIQGAAMTYDFGKAGRLGLTGMQQKTGSSGLGNTILNRFYGYGGPADLYYLDYQPDRHWPVIVKVDGILQVEGVDYNFLTESPYIFQFTRIIAKSQLIDVTYRPVTTQNVDGDRNVWGVDYRLPFGKDGKRGYLQYSQATGELKNDANPLSGTARGIEGQYKLGEFTFRGSTHDIPRGYVSVQSLGFQRNENATSVGLDWTHRRWSLTMDSSNSLVSNRSTDSSNNIVWDSARYTRTSATGTYRTSESSSWSLSHSRVRSFYNGDRELDTTGLTGRNRFGRLDTDYSVQSQTGSVFSSDTDGTLTRERVTLQTFGTGLRYTLPNGIGLNARASVSKVNVSGDDHTGTDYSVGAAYNPEKSRLRMTIGHTRSDAGQLSTLGDFSGYGYGGNGFSTGLTGSGTYYGTGTSVDATTLTAGYQASSKLSLDTHATISENRGSLSSNSRSTSYGVGCDWDLGNFTQLGLNLDNTKTKFLSTTGIQTDSTSLDAYVNAAPRGRWSYRMSVSKFISGGASQYDQDALSFDGLVGYKLTPNQRLAVQFTSGRTTGYYGQSESALFFSYERQIFGNVSLIGSYKIRDVRNLNASDTSGAYRSRGFDLELSFDFR